MDPHIVLELNPSASNGRNSEGAFITLRDGRILFAYTKYTTNGAADHDPSVIACRVSPDGGRSWNSEDRILVEPDGARNVMSVSLLRLANQRIVLLYLRKTITGGGISCTPWIRYSDDEMASLSEPLPLIPEHEYHCVNNDRIIQLRSGRLVVPVAQHRMGKRGFTNPGLIFYLLSDDNGATWTESQSSYYRCFPDGSGWQEPGVIELADGRLWSWMRTGWRGTQAQCGHQWQSFSNDQGTTWSEPEVSQFVSPYSPLSMKRLPASGDLLAVWNDHSGRFPTPSYKSTFWNGSPWEIHRTPLSCAISQDEGISWHHHYLLEDAPDHGFAYTAIHCVEDAVLLAYCAGGASTKTMLDKIRMRRIPLHEIYPQK